MQKSKNILPSEVYQLARAIYLSESETITRSFLELDDLTYQQYIEGAQRALWTLHCAGYDVTVRKAIAPEKSTDDHEVVRDEKHVLAENIAETTQYLNKLMYKACLMDIKLEVNVTNNPDLVSMQEIPFIEVTAYQKI